MTPPKVLVLMAAHNGEQWIVEQIESILKQSDVSIDLVISDDGSSDGTRKKISQFSPDNRVSTLCPAVATGSAAQNFLWLIRNTNALEHQYIAFADQDDIWAVDKLSRACSILQESEAAGYSCAVAAFWRDGKEKILSQCATPTASDFLFEGAGQGCTFVLRQDFFRAIQEYFVRRPSEWASLHYHDWAFYALSRSWRLPWYFDDLPMVRYRQHENNDTGARASMGGIAKRFRLIKSGWYHRQLIVIAALCRDAAPDDTQISSWSRLVAMSPGFQRQLSIIRLCFTGGRRRLRDNVVLIMAAILCWI